MGQIEVMNVRKVYRRDQFEVPVLDGLTLSVDEGEFVALMGPSGSGKTTLLNLIGGIDQPTSGSITVESVDTARLSVEGPGEVALAQRRVHLPALQPHARADRAAERRAAAAAGQGHEAARSARSARSTRSRSSGSASAPTTTRASSRAARSSASRSRARS